MSESITTVLRDTGYVDDVDKYCEGKTSTRKGYHLRSMLFLFEKEDSISVKSTSSYTGLNKHSGKRWFRVETEFHYTFKIRQLKSEKKYLYIWSIPVNRRLRNYPVELYVDDIKSLPDVVIEKVIEFCSREIVPIPNYLTHPMDIISYYSKPNTLLVKDLNFISDDMKKKKISLRTSKPSDVMKAMLGDRYSKKLSSLLIGKFSTRSFSNIRNYPKEFKSDWIIEFIKDKEYHSEFSGMVCPQQIVEIVPEHLRRKFFLCFLEEPWIMNDISRLMNSIGINKESFSEYKSYLSDPYNRSSLNNLHDLLIDVQAAMRDKKDSEPYELDPLPEGLIVEGFRLPTCNKDLREWSKTFSNCVSGYAREVSNKETIVLNRNNEVCLEIQDKKLKQYLGRFNQPVSEEEFWFGVDILLEHGMIEEQPKQNECWGYQTRTQKELVNHD